jgi:DNA uptake protein ComE-like DNA-binding protein
MNLRPFPAIVLTALFVACGGDAAQEAPSAEDVAATDATPSVDAEATTIGASTLIDPNDAGRDALLAVEGLDEASVDALIAGRPYADMLEVDAILAEHLDEGGRELVYASVWKPIDINAASGDEILLIPGVGERMEHEFEEYRPYRAMAEFHREIGKYVDEAEVRRLAMYVELR